MGPFLMDHSIPKIMVLGWWSSDMFLVYICAQVLEWANNMSEDMIKHNDFLDVSCIGKIKNLIHAFIVSPTTTTMTIILWVNS
mmetsp:Transcript_38182/g.43579  ORF Transcript_38182/g.43579 Transcript_38182/m.43579 type:complete len:83 (-) Transcript_38182:71-319(-)